jgi:demethylmenaquinone methyltransferase/2-methoxy-6-polyprenyl-1,4-benzoquinol methylase
MTEPDTYLQSLLVTNPLTEPTVGSAIQDLRLPLGSRVLDAGCGIGLQTLLLAEAVGPDGHITGLDLSPGFLAHAKAIVAEAGLADRISFKEGNVIQLPFDSDTFDWVWSANCIGYTPLEHVQVVKEAVRVVKPGGSVIILLWASQQLLPGYPLLESHLNATSSGIAPFTKGKSPGLHSFRALGWFRDAGLEEVRAKTFVDTVYAPLSDEIRNALVSLLEMRWVNVQSELSEEDWIEYQRLCQPESPDFILNLPDYYAFFTYSMFQGKVPMIKS